MVVAGIVEKASKEKENYSYLEKEICLHGAFEEKSIFYFPK